MQEGKMSAGRDALRDVFRTNCTIDDPMCLESETSITVEALRALGYVIVPVEPTREMTAAAQTRWNAGHDRTAWRLMIDEALK